MKYMVISQGLFCQPSTFHICEGFYQHFPNIASRLVLRTKLFCGFYHRDRGGSGTHSSRLTPSSRLLFLSHMDTVDCQCFLLNAPGFFLQVLFMCVMLHFEATKWFSAFMVSP